MRTFSRVFLLVLGLLLGSAATSHAVVYEVSWVDVLFEPTYDHVDPRFLAGHPSGMVPVTVNGSLVWDSDSHQMVAGIIAVPSSTGVYPAFDRERWTVTGMYTPGLYYGLWESGQGTYYLYGETGFGGVFQFLNLSAPSAFPDFTVGIYDATTTPGNSLRIFSTSAITFTPVGGEIRVVAVPEPPTWLLMLVALTTCMLLGLRVKRRPERSR